MRIKSIRKAVVYFIETTDSQWPTYQRMSANNWQNLMGESWENIFYEEELEKEFQQYLKIHKELTS